MNNINPQFIKDLEIYTKVTPILDSTITLFGRAKFYSYFERIMCNKKELLDRQKFLYDMAQKYKVRNYMKKQLLTINKNYNSIKWYIEHNTNDVLYFKTNKFNSKFLLSLSNLASIYNPSLNVIIYVLIYLVFQYAGIQINIKEYMIQMYNSQRTFIIFIMKLFIQYDNINNIVSHILASSYSVYQVYNIYKSITYSIEHNKICQKEQDKAQKLKEVIDAVYNIIQIDVFSDTQRKDIVNKQIKILKDMFSYNNINNIGYVLALKKERSYYKYLVNCLEYVSEIDANIAITNLLLYKGYTFPKYTFNSNHPIVEITGVRNPILQENQIVNDFSLGSHRLCIITGPNTSGKSIYMRSVIIAIYLSQCLGVTCCQDITMTPFHHLFTYLNVPDVVGKDSLFEAEMDRCLEYIRALENLPKDMFSFAIIDELFTGTDPKSGLSGSFAVLDYISRKSNSLLAISTHFHNITKLKRYKPHLVINKKFELVIKPSGEIIRTYKVLDGVSTQNVAIQLLKDKGFDMSIIALAHYYTENIDKI